MSELKIKKYNLNFHQKLKDGTNLVMDTKNLSLNQEMLVIGLIDKLVDKLGIEDAKKLFNYIKSK